MKSVKKNNEIYKKLTVKDKLEKVEIILKQESERERLKVEADRIEKENKEEKGKRVKEEKIEKKRRFKEIWENVRLVTNYFDDEENKEWEGKRSLYK